MQFSAFANAYLHILDPVNPSATEVRKIEAQMAGVPVGSHVYIGKKQYTVSRVWLALDDEDGEDGVHLQLAPI
jgi:hypothetical protein